MLDYTLAIQSMRTDTETISEAFADSVRRLPPDKRTTDRVQVIALEWLIKMSSR